MIIMAREEAHGGRYVAGMVVRRAQDYVPRGDLGCAIGTGLWMLLRRIVVERDGLRRIEPDDRALLGYYANAIEPALERAGAGGIVAPAPLAWVLNNVIIQIVIINFRRLNSARAAPI